MADFNKFAGFTTYLGGEVNLNSDVLGVMLSNTIPSNANRVRADIIEITPENGYVIGGPDVNIVSWGDSDIAGVAELVLESLQILATGGTMGPFQHAVLYDKSATDQPLIGWYDYPIEILLADTEHVQLIFDDGSDNGTITVGP